MQVPIGLEDDFEGLVDLVQSKAYYFHGSSGSVFISSVRCFVSLISFLYVNICINISFLDAAFCSEEIVTNEIPANMEALVAEKRRELIEVVSEVDDKLAEAFLSDEPITPTELEVRWMEKST